MLALSFPALAVSIACALAYSGSDYFRKAVPHTCGTPLALFYAFALEIPVLAVWMWISGDARLTVGYIGPGLAVAAIGLAANVLFLVALRRSPLSLMVPLLALIPVLTTLLGGALLGEWPTVRQGAGIVLVAAGLFTLYMPAGSRNLAMVWHNLRHEPGAGPMMAVVLLWSITPPLDKISLEHASIGVHGVVQLAALWAALGLWLARGGLGAFVVPPGSMKPLLGAALTAGVGYGLQLAAYQMTLVAVVELFKRVIGLIGALILGRAFFQETVTGPKLLGIAIMAVGLPLVLLG
jgi:drug/metabolite transporter (DMT)-like permease